MIQKKQLDRESNVFQLDKCMKPRWNPEEFFDDEDDIFLQQTPKKKSFFSIVCRLSASIVIWTMAAFIVGCILAGLCLGIYFVMDAHLYEYLHRTTQ
ncbi:MAG: hypothetical protein ACW99G_02710 [Candidatus Thorarchaeota archaeon]